MGLGVWVRVGVRGWRSGLQDGAHLRVAQDLLDLGVGHRALLALGVGLGRRRGPRDLADPLPERAPKGDGAVLVQQASALVARLQRGALPLDGWGAAPEASVESRESSDARRVDVVSC